MKYYDEHASEYIASTIDTDMSKAYSMVSKYIPDGGLVLDVGFGSARDMIYFRNSGYQVSGIDACDLFVKHALDLNLDAKKANIVSYDTNVKYDLIWCCASFLHLKRDDVFSAIKRYLSFLKKDGILFLSMKYIDKDDGYDEKGRYFTYFNDADIEQLKKYTKEISFTKDKTRDDLSWVNFILTNMDENLRIDK